jgi:hypothetical protein
MARNKTPTVDFTPAGVLLLRPDSIHEKPFLPPAERQPLRLRLARSMGPGGAMLTMSFLGALRAVPNRNVMGAAKAALEAATRHLVHDLGPEGMHFQDLVDKWSRLMDYSRDQAVKLEHIEDICPFHF